MQIKIPEYSSFVNHLSLEEVIKSHHEDWDNVCFLKYLPQKDKNLSQGRFDSFNSSYHNKSNARILYHISGSCYSVPNGQYQVFPQLYCDGESEKPDSHGRKG